MDGSTTNQNNRPGDRAGERGSALVYILIAIALLAALTITFMEPSSQQTQSQNTFKLVSELQSQADFIRTAVQECALSYPAGDINIPNAASQSDEGAHKRYPINPDSAYFSDADLGQAGNSFVESIRCPGQQDGPQPKDHARIFGGASGRFLSPPPPLFGKWQWYNGKDGVFFWTSTDKTDAFIQTSLQKLDEAFSDCEADIIQGGNDDLDQDGAVKCNAGVAGATCFRVWVITDNVAGTGQPEEGSADPETSLYPDEAACN